MKVPKVRGGPRNRTRAIALAVAIAAPLSGCGGESETPPVADPQTRRITLQGPVIGFSPAENTAHVWRGRPFARPRVAELRWRAPRPPLPWDGTREALEHGPACVQFAGPLGGSDGEPAGEVAGSEDCLVLNVFAPPFEENRIPTGADRLPVLFWIHGGGNTIGDARIYDAGRLAVEQRVIVVAVQYRLGVLGWLSHPALRGGGLLPDDRSGNYGTLDLVRALSWVRENIRSFGGDPARVTIFGESAGGRNVYSLMLTPRGRGLFHGAIAQSGRAATTPRHAAENLSDDPDAPGQKKSSGEVLLSMLQADGYASDRSAAGRHLAGMEPEAIAAYLRGKSPEQLLAHYDGNRTGGMYRVPQLIRDGDVLPQASALDALRSGAYNRVPFIAGTNHDESKLFMALGSDDVARLFGLPVWVKDQASYDRESRYQSEMWKAQGVDEPVAAMRGVQGPSVFAYRFDWDEESSLLWLDLSKLIGAAHAVEIPFIFGGFSFGPGIDRVFPNDDEEKRSQYLELSRQMQSYWAEFAYTGDPGRGRGGDLPHWTAWNGDSVSADKYILFDSQAGGGLRMSSDSVDSEELLAELVADESFSDEVQRCRILRGWNRGNDPWPALSEALARCEAVGAGA